MIKGSGSLLPSGLLQKVEISSPGPARCIVITNACHLPAASSCTPGSPKHLASITHVTRRVWDANYINKLFFFLFGEFDQSVLWINNISLFSFHSHVVSANSRNEETPEFSGPEWAHLSLYSKALAQS